MKFINHLWLQNKHVVIVMLIRLIFFLIFLKQIFQCQTTTGRILKLVRGSAGLDMFSKIRACVRPVGMGGLESVASPNIRVFWTSSCLICQMWDDSFMDYHKWNSSKDQILFWKPWLLSCVIILRNCLSLFGGVVFSMRMAWNNSVPHSLW